MNESETEPQAGSNGGPSGRSPDDSPDVSVIDAGMPPSGATNEDRQDAAAPQGIVPAEPLLKRGSAPQRLAPVYDGDLKRQYKNVIDHNLSVEQRRESVREYLAKSLMRILTCALVLGFLLI